MSDITLHQPLEKPRLEIKERAKNAVFEQWPFVALCLIYFLSISVYLISNGHSQTIELAISIVRWFALNFLIFGSATLSIYAVRFFAINRPKDSPTKALWADLRTGILKNSNLPKIMIAAVGLSLVMSVFVEFKATIPLIKPFAYDIWFADVDLWLHGGYQPWELLQNIIPYEWMTWIIHRNYYLWFPVIFMTYLWQCCETKNLAVKKQFLLSFVACWVIIGSLMAVALSSAGPIFYSNVVSDNGNIYYAAEEYLSKVHATSPLFMFDIKEKLWLSYQTVGDTGAIKGISAMPSMHVSLAFLLMLFGFQKGKFAAIFYSVFGILIMIGSVHLLWHYAIDGYVSIIATYIIWKVCGWITQKKAEPAENTGSA